MSAADEFLAKQAEVEHARKPAPEHPKGWEPHVVWDGTRGQVTGRVNERPKDWHDLITSMGLDPDEVEVVEPVRMAWWDVVTREGTERAYYARANIRRRHGAGADIAELLRHVKRRKPAKVDEADPAANAFFVGFSDWQLGKRGTPEAVDRIVAGIDRQARRLRELRRLGRRIDTAVLGNLGDIGEACDGHYPSQRFQVELSDREQQRLGRRLFLYGVDTFAPLVDLLLQPAVGGNHGEKRNESGGFYTDAGDNADLEVSEGVAEACAVNPAAYGHVKFIIPEQDLSLTLDVKGVILGMAHGHQAKRGGTTVQQKVATWWAGQSFGRRPVGDADVLVTGHNHHFSVVEYADRWHIQCSTLDSGSPWWGETAGLDGPGSMASFVVGPDYPMRWGDLYLT
jgi:hypothetical protein